MSTWNVGYDASGSALDYTTMALALASASVVNGDTLVLWYADAKRNRIWATNTGINKQLTITGGLSSRRIQFFRGADTFNVGASNITIANLTLNAGPGSYGVEVSGAYTGILVKDCLTIGCNVGVLVNHSSAAVTVENCVFVGGGDGVQVAAGTSSVTACLAIGQINGYRNLASASNFTVNNSIACWGRTNCFTGSYNAASTNNVSTDATAPGSNPTTNATDAAIGMACDNSDFLGVYDYRSKVGTALLTGGAAVSLSADMDGVPYGGVYPIGPSVGLFMPSTNKSTILTTATPAGLYVPPSVADVRPITFGVSQTGTLANLDGTESAYTTLEGTRNTGVTADKILTGNSIKIANVTTAGSFDEAARNSDPGVGNVFDSTAYKIANVAKVGTLPAATVLVPKGTFDEEARNSGATAEIIKKDETIVQRGVSIPGAYDPSFVPFVAPTISLTAGDESIIVTCTPATGAETARIYVRYWLMPGAVYSDESLTASRVGAGDVTIPSLANNLTYGVIAYHKDGNRIGYTSGPGFVVPASDEADAANMLETGAAWLSAQRKSHLSNKVTYKRGATSIKVLAMISRTVFAAADLSGAIVSSESKDFIIEAADFLSMGEPQAGDSIIYSGQTYEVMAPAGETIWRWSDLYNKTMRIHAKLVKKGI